MILYFIISIVATTLGAVTGMGGGVIIKPVLDMMGHYDVASISILSSITVFAMAVVSFLRLKGNSDNPKATVTVPLSIGAVVGGNLGSLVLKAVISRGAKPSNITVVQNIILAALIVLVFIYMIYKEKLKSPGLVGLIPAMLTGLLLGVISSFLGIGGGPVNVALIIFLFAFSSKTAATCSLLIILFSQASKLFMASVTGGFLLVDLTMLPVMLLGGVLGGIIGGEIHKRINDKMTDKLFNGAQVVVFCICIINILRNV